MGVILPKIHKIIQGTLKMETMGTLVRIVGPYDLIAFVVGIQTNDTPRGGHGIRPRILVGRRRKIMSLLPPPPYASMRLPLCNCWLVLIIRMTSGVRLWFIHKVIRFQCLLNHSRDENSPFSLRTIRFYARLHSTYRRQGLFFQQGFPFFPLFFGVGGAQPNNKNIVIGFNVVDVVTS
jgi:hypothetical protein